MSAVTQLLRIYRAPSGEWAGRIYEEVGGIAGCTSPDEVIEAARAAGWVPEVVVQGEDEDDGPHPAA